MAKIFGFEVKTKADREKEQQEYFLKIFPDGETHRAKIISLLAEKFPNFEQKYVLFHFVTIKEKALKLDLSLADDIIEMVTDMPKKQFTLKMSLEQKQELAKVVASDILNQTKI